MSRGSKQVAVQGIQVTQFRQAPTNKREQVIDRVRLTLLAGSGFIVPGVRLWGSLPWRYRLEPIPGKGQEGRGVEITHRRGRWVVTITGARAEPVLQVLRADPNNFNAVMVAARPLKAYVQQGFHLIRPTRQRDTDF